jgi:hypothetical protein
MVEILQFGLFCVNDESSIDVKVPQVMHYILCYNRLVSHAILGQITRVMK